MVNPSHKATAPRTPDDGQAGLPWLTTFLQPETHGAVACELPRVVFIEVANHCNLLHETCARTFVTYEAPKPLAWEEFLRLEAQFPGLQQALMADEADRPLPCAALANTPEAR